jgi:chaperone modulatory protein CbpM
MITFEAVLLRVSGLDAQHLEAWIARGWVRPDRRAPEGLVFEEIDVARCRLILELGQLEVSEAAMPVVLGLLDQLHQTRRQLRRLAEALESTRAPHD